MPIREASFRIGCGRYLQEAGILAKCGEEVCRLGHSPLIIGGKTALEKTRCVIEKSVGECCPRYYIEEHRGTCNDERAMELATFAKAEGYDVIVGVGGGVLMDFAKLCAHFARLPVINIPTSSATCAAFTPLSVRYTPEGRTVGTMHFPKEVDAVLADTAILAAQPPRLLLAGVFDALAKFVEIKHRFNEEIEQFPLGLDWAYLLSKHSFHILNTKTEQCLADMQAGKITDAVEQILFTAICATGVISGIARGSNQTALAHKFYENTRYLFQETARPYLHGEIVGVGLLLQNRFNGEESKNQELLELMKRYSMPHTVNAVGVPKDQATWERYYDRLINSSAIEKGNEEEYGRLRESLCYLWEIK